jgi:hypothetical protein
MRGQPGAVGVYRKGGKGSWSLVQTLTSGEDMADDSFGTQLAISHGALVVGAAGADGGRGAAFIFRRAGAHWVAWQKLTRVDGESGDAFGTAVDIASRRIAVGAPGALLDPQGLCGPPSGAGEVDVFEPLGGQWMQTQTISTPIANCTLGFGVNVAVGGGHLVGVTPSSYPYTTGAAFVYARGNAGLAPQGMAPDGEAVNNLVVELDRSTLFVGLPLDEEYATGYVEVFALGNAEGDSEAAAADH